MFNPMMALQMMMQNNPQLGKIWQTAQQMTQGKSPQEIQQIAKNLAQQRGLDLGQVESAIQQFMGGNIKF